MSKPKRYGKEIILDVHLCNVKKFSRRSLDAFFSELCTLSKMTAVGKPHYWLEHTPVPHLKGYSGIQFIKTSSILIHTLDMTQSCYINFFSCKDFDTEEVVKFVTNHFQALKVKYKTINRV